MRRAQGRQAQDAISHSQSGDRVTRIEPPHAVGDEVHLAALHGFIVLEVFLEVGRSLLDTAGEIQGRRLGHRVTGGRQCFGDAAEVRDRRVGQAQPVEAEDPVDQDDGGSVGSCSWRETPEIA